MWELSRKLIKEANIIPLDYPSEEKYGLVSQITKCFEKISTSRNKNLTKG